MGSNGQHQSDFGGPFEVISRIPDSTCYVVTKEKRPLRRETASGGITSANAPLSLAADLGDYQPRVRCPIVSVK